MAELQANPAAVSPCATPISYAPQNVYAIGRIEPLFRDHSTENYYIEFCTQHGFDASLTDYKAVQKALKEKEAQDIVENLCWALKIDDIPRYFLEPSGSNWSYLVDSLHRTPRPPDFDVVIGVLDSSLVGYCGDITAPTIRYSKIYTTNYASFVEHALQAPQGVKTPPEKKEELPNDGIADTELVVSLLPHNLGVRNEDRAFNFLLFRHLPIYGRTAERLTQNFELTRVVKRSVAGYPYLVDVILVYTNRDTAFTEAYSARVDVLGMYPELKRELTRYYAAKEYPV
jgi:hypothetical protein